MEPLGRSPAAPRGIAPRQVMAPQRSGVVGWSPTKGTGPQRKRVIDMTGIGTCLWFDGKAEEAENFYVGLFPNSRIVEVARWGRVAPGSRVRPSRFPLNSMAEVSALSTAARSVLLPRPFPLNSSLTRRRSWMRSGVP